MHILDAESGYALSQEHQRIAEIIKDYEPTLELAWIPPDKRGDLEDFAYPFAIIHRPPNLRPYIVRKLQEHEVDHRLLAWLWSSDRARNGLDLGEQLQNEATARQILQLKERADEMAEKHDIAASILGSPLNTYRHDGVTYR